MNCTESVSGSCTLVVSLKLPSASVTAPNSLPDFGTNVAPINGSPVQASVIRPVMMVCAAAESTVVRTMMNVNNLFFIRKVSSKGAGFIARSSCLKQTTNLYYVAKVYSCSVPNPWLVTATVRIHGHTAFRALTPNARSRVIVHCGGRKPVRPYRQEFHYSVAAPAR